MSRFMNNLKRRVGRQQKKIVLPESDSRRILQAVDQIETEGFAKTVLVGKPRQLMERAFKYQIDLDGVEIIDPETYPMLDTFSRFYAEKRRKKGMTVSQAREILLTDYICFGACLVAFDIVDGMVGGATVPSADLIRAALQIVGMHPGISTVSSSFIIITDKPQFGDDGIFVLGDASVVIEPTAQQLADITVNCVHRARRTVQTLDPKAALLSYSTLGSGSGEQVDRVREAARLLRDRNVDFDFDGELQSDAAIIPRVARYKAPGSTVAGQANVLVFPNLESGNICYKILQHLYGAIALGPLLEGTAKPIMDLSRGCSAEDIVDIVAICCSDAIYQDAERRRDQDFTSHFAMLDHRVAVDEHNISIRFDGTKCQNCSLCRRRCAEVMTVTGYYSLASTGDTPICVHCGQCSLVCPFGATKSISQETYIEQAMADPDKIVVFQTGAAVRVALGEEFGLPYGTNVEDKLIGALRELGGDYVFDTNAASDIAVMEEVAELRQRLKEHRELTPMFTSVCPSWIEFMEIFFPELLPHLSTAKSPTSMMGAVIKTYLAKTLHVDPERIVTVSITPCTAKKAEISRPERNAAGQFWQKPDMRDTDYCLTVRELANWMRRKDMNLTDMPASQYDAPFHRASGGAMLVGASGGMMEAMMRTFAYEETGKVDEEFLHFTPVRGLTGVKEASVSIGDALFRVAVVSGLGNARAFINRLKEKHSWKKYTCIEIMACPGGCIGGGGQPRTEMADEIPAKRARMEAIYQADANNPRHGSWQDEAVRDVYAGFLGEPLGPAAHALLHTQFINKHYLLGKEDRVSP
ncbi:phosphate acetyltransferase [uncultured Megasphaera sp.]|uniref:phosphate acetyltransferase n=1 Tax=uncultured Megasphaera sp. TaxID=165188 RepID=UPI0034662989